MYGLSSGGRAISTAKATKVVRASARVEGDDPKRPRAVHLEGYWEPLDDVRYRVVNNAFIPSPAQQRDASVKNIRVNAEAYARLRKMRRSGESASALVERLAFELTS